MPFRRVAAGIMALAERLMWWRTPVDLSMRAVVVRDVQPGETWAGLLNELIGQTWTTGDEHAIISTRTGSRVIVRGCEFGIEFGPELAGRMRRVILHTHPRPTGPSLFDRRMLRRTAQRSSWLREIGGAPPQPQRFWRI
jgi:hypothetical protein